MQWLDKGIYEWEAQHPPLSRVAVALGPYLSGIRSQNTPPGGMLSMSYEGVAILYSGHHYDRTLVLARLGNLPFFWLACAVVYWWGARSFGRAVAVVAVFLFSFLPTVLGHSGLATTDMALTAGVGAAFAAGYYWLTRPSFLSAAWFGAATAIMVLSKFSGLVFLPAAAALSLAWYLYAERPPFAAVSREVRNRLPSLGLAALVTILLVWAGYRFSIGDSGILHLRLPAPELFAGIRQVIAHNAGGQSTFLLGTRSNNGFWMYFPVALSVKTPLAFLALAGYGVVLVIRRRPPIPRLWIPLTFSAGILIPAMCSSINIGLRHILPIYLGLSLLAAAAVVRILEKSAGRRWLGALLVLLLGWFAASSALAHPDYFPYFNELALGQPEKILADSDLDWGQDLKRLSARLRELGVKQVAFDQYIVGDWQKEHGFPPFYRVDPYRPTMGWTAISVGVLKQTSLVLWADHFKPQERVGKSIFLWYFPP